MTTRYLYRYFREWSDPELLNNTFMGHNRLFSFFSILLVLNLIIFYHKMKCFIIGDLSSIFTYYFLNCVGHIKYHTPFGCLLLRVLLVFQFMRTTKLSLTTKVSTKLVPMLYANTYSGYLAICLMVTCQPQYTSGQICSFFWSFNKSNPMALRLEIIS